MRTLLVLISIFIVGCAPTTFPEKPPERDDHSGVGFDSINWWTGVRTGSEPSAYTPLALSAMAIDGAPELLRLTIQNNTDESVTLRFCDLPWKNLGRLRVLAVSGTGELLSTVAPVADCAGGNDATVPPRGTITGDLDLGYRVHALAASREEADVLLFWSYSFTTADEPSTAQVVWVLLPRTTGS